MSKLDDSFWHFFLMLESDFNNIIRYIELTEENENTYSIELARQYVSICTEVETVARILCKKIDETKKAEKINHYREIILSKHPDIHTVPVYIDRSKRTIFPLESFSENKTPDWWSIHQDVKHHRHENFTKATLKNTLHALAGLLILELYLYGYNEERKGGCTLLRAPSMTTPYLCREEEELPDLFTNKEKNS